MQRPLIVAMVAGELSGDLLGCALMEAIRKQVPAVRFVGIGGPQMIAAGFESWYPMERLSVMGLVEVLGRLFELLRMRRALAKRLITEQPDVFVGIDAPDFNLGLALRLRRAGLRTVHFVSPSVWAWRQGRVKTIRKAVDRMLTLLPFEADFYHRHAVPVTFVGHPLADIVPLADQRDAARMRLGLSAADTIIALLPGSRGGEVAQLLPVFLQAAVQIAACHERVRFVLPAATVERRRQVEAILATTFSSASPAPNIMLLDGDARTAMAAADVVMLASGTATLEALLAKRPMVVAYRVHAITWAILSRLVRAKFVSLPNLLADELLVPELLQDAVTPNRLAAAVGYFLDHPDAAGRLRARFADMHRELCCHADNTAADRAADAVLAVIAGRSAL